MNMKVFAVLTFCLLTLGLLPLTLSVRETGKNATAQLPVLAVHPDGPSGDLTAYLQVAAGGAQAPQDSSWDRKVSALSRSLIAGLSTSLGAAVVLMASSSPTAAQMAFALSLAGGVMVTVSLVELNAPKIIAPGWRFEAIFFSLVGVLAFALLRRLVPEPDYAAEADVEVGATDKDEKDLIRKGKQWRLAVIMMIALTAHNFPEGIAVAISSMHDERLGFVVMAAIAVHNIPEGIAIAMPVLDATKNRWRAMQMATLSGLAEPLGALVALTILPQDMLQGRSMDALLCVVGGIMICVACIELFPEAIAQKEPMATFAGTVTGMVVMLVTMSLA